MKRIILALCLLVCAPALADSAPISSEEIKEVEEFFNSYVDSANNYKDDLPEKYTENAIIKRVVIKPDGSKEAVTIPFARYVRELKKGRKVARLARYKNSYSNRKYFKTGNDEYRIKTLRTPSRDNSGLDAEFTIVKTPDGYKISMESMDTTVQRFLDEE